MGFARRMHLSDRHDPGPTLLPPAAPRLVVLSDPGLRTVPLREQLASRRGRHRSPRSERGHGGPRGFPSRLGLEGDSFSLRSSYGLVEWNGPSPHHKPRLMERPTSDATCAEHRLSKPDARSSAADAATRRTAPTPEL